MTVDENDRAGEELLVVVVLAWLALAVTVAASWLEAML